MEIEHSGFEFQLVYVGPERKGDARDIALVEEGAEGEFIVPGGVGDGDGREGVGPYLELELFWEFSEECEGIGRHGDCSDTQGTVGKMMENESVLNQECRAAARTRARWKKRCWADVSLKLPYGSSLGAIYADKGRL